jgi:hypothetical protein
MRVIEGRCVDVQRIDVGTEPRLINALFAGIRY